MATAAECLELIEGLYPNLWVRTHSFVDEGQNNDVLIVNGEIVFRFPRTVRAARHLRLEAAILARIQDRVTLMVPNPTYLSLGSATQALRVGGTPAWSYRWHGHRAPWDKDLGGRMPWEQDEDSQKHADAAPWDKGLGGRLPWQAPGGPSEPGTQGVFIGYHLIPGEPLWREHLMTSADEPTVQAWADQLGEFLKELHATPLVGELGTLLARHDGRARWADFHRRVRHKVFPHMRPEARVEVGRRFQAFLNEPKNFAYKPVLVHGDFGPSNILFDATAKRITGIIDFGSAGLDDPAVDLAALMGPYGYGEAFVRRMGRRYSIDEEVLDRARFYVTTFDLQDAVYGLENGDQEAFNAGIRAYR